MAATNLTCAAAGLTPARTYYFTFCATNTSSSLWAANVQRFTTPAPPVPPTPVLPAAGCVVTGGVPTFTFPTVAGFKYRLVFKNELSDATWQALLVPPEFSSPEGWSATSTGASMSIADPEIAGRAQRFYRLEAAHP